MRRSVMIRDQGDRIVVETDDAGTQVLDGKGVVLATHGTDRHAEMVAEREAAGWRLAEDGDIRPPTAEHAPLPHDGPAGPAGEVDTGPSS